MSSVRNLKPLPKEPTGPLNPYEVRKDFALFESQPNLAFLDSAASAQKPAAVLDAMRHFYEQSYANVHRGVYQLSSQATAAYERARETVAEFISAPHSRNIIFTRGATEGINLIAQTWGKANLKAGDGVVISELEHHANIVPWQMLRDDIGIKLQIAKIDESGHLSAQAVAEAMDSSTKLVAVSHMSNATGCKPDVEGIIKQAKAADIPVLLDGCQAVVHGGVDVASLGADFYVFSSHKLYGPTGIGVTYIADKWLDDLPPYQGGGDMIKTVSFEKTTYAEAPARFEAGTPHIAGAIGLAAAIEYIRSLGMSRLRAHEDALLAYATGKLEVIDGLSVQGKAPKGPIISFTMDGLHPHDIATILDECGVAVRAGHHCAQPLMARLGVSATTRASFAAYNTQADVDKLIDGLMKAKDLLGG